MQCKGIDLEKMTSSGRMELERGELLELLEAQWIYNSLEPRGWLRLIPSRTARMVEQGYIKYQGRLGQKKIDALTKQHPEVYKRWLERDIDSGFDDLLRGEMAREGSTRDDTEEAIVKRRWLASPAPAAAEQRQELWLSWGGSSDISCSWTWRRPCRRRRPRRSRATCTRTNYADNSTWKGYSWMRKCRGNVFRPQVNAQLSQPRRATSRTTCGTRAHTYPYIKMSAANMRYLY